MKWYDWIQYGVLVMMAVAIPIAWHYALWVASVLGLVTIIKVIAQRKVWNPSLGTLHQVALCGPVVYWLVLALSLLWSSDIATGLEVLRLKAVLLIFPICLLLSDTTYLTSRHLRGLGYALLTGAVCTFLYFIVNAGIEVSKGMEFKSFQNTFYSPGRSGVDHHAYIALYTVVAMAFVYHELFRHWKELKGWLRIVLIVSLLLIINHTVIVNSRAGMLVMGLTVVACVVHLVIMQHSWKLGLLVGLLAAAFIVAATQFMPGYVDRIASTVEHAEDDARTFINRSNLHAFTASPIVGYGVGDYHAVQIQHYTADAFEAGIKAEYNAHNQYMESLVSAGVLGLLSLLFFLLTPLFVAWRRHSPQSFLLAVLTGIVMFNLLFESMLERQMGLLFIGPLFAVMVLILSVEENKFVQSSKS